MSRNATIYLMKLGTTVSHRHLQHLECDVVESLNVACEMGFNILRLGVYWDESEVKQDVYSWKPVAQMLDICENLGQKVILSVGCKAPRYPEFYFPDWVERKNPAELQTHILEFLEQAVMFFDQFSCIEFWQVENEPLDPVWPGNLSVPLDLLQREVELVRSLSRKKVMINDWGNDLSSRGTLDVAAKMADAVGIDLYYKQHIRQVFGKSVYSGPRDSDQKLTQMIDQCQKPVWIAELQAEPWEKNDQEYRKPITNSMSPVLLQEYYQRAQTLPVEGILLWGFEWWVYQAKQGNTEYVDTVSELLTS